MKYLKFGPVLIVAALLLACGNDHLRLMSVTVSPSTATVSMRTSMMGGPMMGTVTFTAMGRFDNNTTRMLSSADGLTWMSSNSMIATVNTNGTAMCAAAGVVRIIASVPVNLSMIMGMNMQTTSSTTTGAATLTCM